MAGGGIAGLVRANEVPEVEKNRGGENAVLARRGLHAQRLVPVNRRATRAGVQRIPRIWFDKCADLEALKMVRSRVQVGTK